MYRRARGYYDGFRTGDKMTQLIAVTALVILVIIALPRLGAIFPYVASGVDCTAMTAPEMTGNNQSLLAARANPADLHLELAPSAVALSAGESLVLEVRFINEGMAPITLFLTPNDFAFRYTGQEPGISFAIQTQGGQVLGEPASFRPVKTSLTQFTVDQLHVLQPRSRCYVRATIDPSRLAAAQVTRGVFFITAVYLNQSKGALPAVGQLTPTPIFKDQGVWTGPLLRSNQITVGIGVPTAAPGQ